LQRIVHTQHNKQLAGGAVCQDGQEGTEDAHDVGMVFGRSSMIVLDLICGCFTEWRQIWQGVWFIAVRMPVGQDILAPRRFADPMYPCLTVLEGAATRRGCRETICAMYTSVPPVWMCAVALPAWASLPRRASTAELVWMRHTFRDEVGLRCLSHRC
jgi:hypothetical protein